MRRGDHPPQVVPLTPEEARDKKSRRIPDYVVRAFNELIVKNITAANVAYIKQDDAIEHVIGVGRAMYGLSLSKNDIIEENFLDVEDLFESAGWDVKYDSPSIGDSYPASFTFTAR